MDQPQLWNGPVDKAGRPAQIESARVLGKYETAEMRYAVMSDEKFHAAVKAAIAEVPAELRERLQQSGKLVGYLTAKAMEKTKGHANPAIIHELIKREVEKNANPNPDNPVSAGVAGEA